nr:MAG TPA: hypothetical protein [Caudoviricetes sp.]
MSKSKLDVGCVAAGATTERGLTRAVSVAHRILHNASHLRSEFQSTDFSSLLLNLALEASLFQSCELVINVLVDGGGVDSTVVVYAVNPALGSAAALRQLGSERRGVIAGLQLQVSLTERNLFAQRSNVALHIVAKATNTVADVSQTVIDLTKVLTEQNVLLGSRSCVLAEFAVVVTATPAAAHEAKEQQNQHQPRNAIATETSVTTGKSGNIGRGHHARIFHCHEKVPPFIKLYILEKQYCALLLNCELKEILYLRVNLFSHLFGLVYLLLAESACLYKFINHSTRIPRANHLLYLAKHLNHLHRVTLRIWC